VRRLTLHLHQTSTTCSQQIALKDSIGQEMSKCLQRKMEETIEMSMYTILLMKGKKTNKTTEAKMNFILFASSILFPWEGLD
jgi:hypothetical protein